MDQPQEAREALEIKQNINLLEILDAYNFENSSMISQSIRSKQEKNAYKKFSFKCRNMSKRHVSLRSGYVLASLGHACRPIYVRFA